MSEQYKRFHKIIVCALQLMNKQYVEQEKDFLILIDNT